MSNLAQAPTISVVSPVYRSEELVQPLVERLEAVLSGMGLTYEIVLVEDRSPDRTWEKLEQVASIKPHVRAFRLSRNFGQHYAISAGVDAALGEWIIVMDCDLQDRPEEIPALYHKALEGYEVVLARRVNRLDTWFKRASSALFYRLLGWLSGVQQDPSVANFGIYHRKVIESVRGLRESIRYFPTMVLWVGFRRTALDVTHAARPSGQTTYSLGRLFKLALDIILAHSDRPLKMVSVLGLWISGLSLVMIAFYIQQYLFGEIKVLGFSSLIIAISFFSGLIIFTLGVVGLYVGKIFEGVKVRPPYIIDCEVTQRSPG